MTRKRRYDLGTPEGAQAYRTRLGQNAGQRKLYEKQCAECGTAFIGLKVARYCSGACRQRHHYYHGQVRG